MVAPVGFQRLEDTFEALILILSKISLSAIEEGDEALVPFAYE